MTKIMHNIESFTNRFNLIDYSIFFKKVDVSQILWNKKPMMHHSVLVWDLENIPFKNLNKIKMRVSYSPEKLYVVTKQKLSVQNINKIEKEGFKILNLHKGISDEKIISVMKLYSMYPNMILVSSDSDFVISAKKYIKTSKLQWIIVDKQKKRIIMKMDITKSNLNITTI